MSLMSLSNCQVRENQETIRVKDTFNLDFNQRTDNQKELKGIFKMLIFNIGIFNMLFFNMPDHVPHVLIQLRSGRIIPVESKAKNWQIKGTRGTLKAVLLTHKTIVSMSLSNCKVEELTNEGLSSLGSPLIVKNKATRQKLAAMNVSNVRGRVKLQTHACHIHPKK